jgi:ribosomal protein S18 acetylase RimI-like enzyme
MIQPFGYQIKPGVSCFMPFSITPERPDTPDARALIGELEAYLDPLYPRESRHGYSVERLLEEAVAFFIIRDETAAVGCGGVKLSGKEYGEIKRMYIRPQFRGFGLAEMMLDHLTGYALAHGVEILRLETGIHQRAAIALYERAGFQRVPPFGNYREDPNSLYFEKRIPNKVHS